MNLPANIHATGSHDLPSIQNRDERDLNAMLATLKARAGPPVSPYDEYVRFKKDNDLIDFMVLSGQRRYIPAGTRIDTLRRAARIAQPLEQPDDMQAKMRALGDLYTLTAGPKRTPQERDHLLSTYLHQMKPYPVPVVVTILREMASKNRFFPTWSEIQSRLDSHSGWRLRAFQRLRAIATSQTTP